MSMWCSHARACDNVVEIAARGRGPYLRIDKMIAAARSSGAQGVHPVMAFWRKTPRSRSGCRRGTGFCRSTPRQPIATMGDKAAARQRAVRARIPVLSGYDYAAQDAETLRRAAVLIGFPRHDQAAAGVAGAGMRRVDDAAHFDAALASARSEAHAAFGDDR